MPSSKDIFLSFVRLGIGHPADTVPADIDWNEVRALADLQGLSAVVMDGLDVLRQRVPELVMPERQFMKQWVGEVLQLYENRYEQYQRAIASLARFYNSHSLKMMVLKGYACSLYWPKPSHRPSGDIDIWQFGQQKEADALLEKEKGVSIDSSHHHHTVFYCGGFMVENHYDFINVYAHSSSKKMEGVFKELGKDDSHFVEVKGESVYIPSPNLHALFLIRHLIAHFASERVSLRQVLDWAFFVEKHTQEIDWNWLFQTLEEYGMKTFLGVLNGICVEDLGFEASLFPRLEYDSTMKARVFNDILSPEFCEEQPSALLPRLIFKFRRWQANAWKQRLCYKESRWSIFWSGIWAHILKPSSI